MDRKTVRAVVLTAVGIMIIVGAGYVLIVYSGEYNVAATQPHFAPVEWTLATVMRHSVQDHAEGIEPPALTDSALVKTGFQHFQAMCVTCHGAPGVQRSEIGKGLLPEPPELSQEVPEWTPAELFWIVKHGIKMSGMPAFGPTHDDRTLWGIVGFLQGLPQSDSAQYATLQQRWGDGSGHGAGAGAHAHGAPDDRAAPDQPGAANDHEHTH